MNKEDLKFKAWDKKRKRLSEVRSIDCSHDIINLAFFPEEGGNCFSTDMLKDIDLIQYSGIKDKEGEEIYDGYYVEIKTWMNLKTVRAEVIFKKGAFMVAGEPLSNWTDVRIIGNKFENPEMDKKEDK